MNRRFVETVGMQTGTRGCWCLLFIVVAVAPAAAQVDQLSSTSWKHGHDPSTPNANESDPPLRPTTGTRAPKFRIHETILVPGLAWRVTWPRRLRSHRI